MVKAKKYSWRKTATFFDKTIGKGTQFDRLPLETLKLIFQYKIIAEDKLQKEQRKIQVNQQRLKQIKEKEEEQERLRKLYEERRREYKKRIRDEENEKLKKRFGKSTFNAMERKIKLNAIFVEEQMENEIRRQEREIRNQQFIERVRQRYYQRGSVDPFTFYTMGF